MIAAYFSYGAVTPAMTPLLIVSASLDEINKEIDWSSHLMSRAANKRVKIQIARQM